MNILNKDGQFNELISILIIFSKKNILGITNKNIFSIFS